MGFTEIIVLHVLLKMNWQRLASIVDRQPIAVRIGFCNGAVTDWSKWLIFPAKSYGEVSRHGPFRLGDVAFVEMNAVERIKPGKLLDWRESDHSEVLEKELDDAGLSFERNNSIYLIRVGEGNLSRP